jgi:hypothetical protein
MDNQYTAQLLRRGHLLVKSHKFENKSQNFNILYIYQPNIYLLIIKKYLYLKKNVLFLHQLMNFRQQAEKRDVLK